MSKHKSPTPPPDSSPLAPDAKAGVPSTPHGRPATVAADAVAALSNAPPYLISRAETMATAYHHTLGHDVTPFSNLSLLDRVAWLAAAKSTES
jgi:hypothetical protein